MNGLFIWKHGIIVRPLLFSIYFFAIASLFFNSVSAQIVEVDVSACGMMYKVLNAMKNEANREECSKMLDSVLAAKPYQIMFMHYNRSWRPNHLPVSVFKRMILSLGFGGEYSPGENQRADQMLAKWKYYYDNLELYLKNLHSVENSDLQGLIKSAVKDAQKWLPPGWNIPDSYFFIHPNGGSNGFVINNFQGYDFFQLPHDSSGNIIWQELVGIVAHESHHLGMQNNISKDLLSSSSSLAYRFLSIFTAEATASKFVDNAPGGNVPAIDQTRGNRFKNEELVLWRKYTDEESEIFKHFISTFEKAFSGQLTEDDLESEMKDYWFTGLKGRAYFIGSELFGAIYYGFGKEGSFEAIKDARKILKLYNDAVKSRSDILGKCFVIPDSVVMHALAIENK